MFGLDLHAWEEIMIWSLAVAAIAALGVLVSTRVVILLQRDALRESAQDFEKYKVEAAVQIAEAGKEAALANAEIEKAKERTATLEKGNLELQTNLEKERSERLKLEAAIAPRTMTPDQRSALVTAWRRFARHRVSVTSYSMDAESALLGQQIASALRDAGLVVVEALTSVVPIGGLTSGIHVTATDVADRELAHGLAQGIGNNTSLVVTYNPANPEGSAAMILGGKGGPPAGVTILIGPKPIARPIK